MKPQIIAQKAHDGAIDSLIDTLEEIADSDANFYVGYPVATTVDDPITVPALLISHKFGLVCFDVIPSAIEPEIETYKGRQRAIVLALKAKLLQHPQLCDEYDLGFRINIITYSTANHSSISLVQANIVGPENFESAIKKCSAFDEKYLAHLNAAIERVANIRPKSKRLIAVSPTSRGTILKEIESKIANLDSWQKAAAIETPNGPQRIRGLAGSGKTIVLALKAAYLHGEKPEWKIGVTFHTRSLKPQFDSLIRRFYFDDYRREPDDAYLQIMHSFGSMGESGIYSEICKAYGITPRNFGYGKRVYGYAKAFQGICQELLFEVEKNPKEIFDAILIDEAQDLPNEFLRLAFLCTRSHRIVWAYDDLQNLSDFQMRSLRETFGEDSRGEAVVNLTNAPKQPRQDIILPICYRNTPWALVAAHALGSGIYRETSIVQHPDNPVLWNEIGYEVVSGELILGQQVNLRRSRSSSPSFFHELISPEDAISFQKFENIQNQFSEISKKIKIDLTVGELYPQDIVVVFPDALNAESLGLKFSQYLFDQGINSHIAGVTSSRDIFHIEGHVTISGPFRAKGNEAPMVYVLCSEFCAEGGELIKKRNILFTAITRSRAWVRVCGTGSGMDLLVDEFNKLKSMEFCLNFKIPTEDELRRMRTLFRDISNTELKVASDIKRAFENLPKDSEEAAAILQTLPKKFRDQVKQYFQDLKE
jgi:superfamily I DNA and RNA helicase